MSILIQQASRALWDINYPAVADVELAVTFGSGGDEYTGTLATEATYTTPVALTVSAESIAIALAVS